MVTAGVVVVSAMMVEDEAAPVDVVCGGSVSGCGEHARTTANTSGRTLDAVIGSSPPYVHSEHRHLDVLAGEDGTGRGQGVGPEQEMLRDGIDIP